MGYRSEVTFVLYAPDDMTLTAFIGEWFDQAKQIVTDHYGEKETEWSPSQAKQIMHELAKDKQTLIDSIESSSEYPDLRFTRIDHNSVKWYDSYPDVKVWERMKDMADTMHEKSGIQITLEFARVGEDQDDVEVEQYGDINQCVYVIAIHREIHVEY